MRTCNFTTVVDCKTVGFIPKISKEIGKACGVRVLRARSARASHANLVSDLLFDCSRVLEYAKIRTVLQSTTVAVLMQLEKHFIK